MTRYGSRRFSEVNFLSSLPSKPRLKMRQLVVIGIVDVNGVGMLVAVNGGRALGSRLHQLSLDKGDIGASLAEPLHSTCKKSKYSKLAGQFCLHLGEHLPEDEKVEKEENKNSRLAYRRTLRPQVTCPQGKTSLASQSLRSGWEQKSMAGVDMMAISPLPRLRMVAEMQAAWQLFRPLRLMGW